MSGSAGYALVEASRGCSHQCNFCTQWEHWGQKWRTKSPERIADEMEYLYKEHESTFLWLTDDNRRIPVQMKSKVIIGSITAELKKMKGILPVN